MYFPVKAKLIMYSIIFTLVIITVSMLIVHSRLFADNPDLLAAAVTMDITLVLPGLYFLLAKRYSIRLITVIPVFLLSLLAANLIIPEDHSALLQIEELLLTPLELAAFAYIVIKIRRVRKEYKLSKGEYKDFRSTLTKVLTNVLNAPAASKIIATEVTLLYFGLFGWMERLPAGKDMYIISSHKKNGYPVIIAFFIFLIFVETAVIHILVMQWSLLAACILSFLSLFAAVFMIADLQLVRKNPSLITDNKLILRTGLRWYTEIDIDNIIKCKAVKAAGDKEEKYINASVFGEPNILIELNDEVVVNGLYTLVRKVNKIAYRADDPDEVLKVLNTRKTK